MDILDFLFKTTLPVALIVISGMIILNKTLNEGLIFLAFGFVIVIILSAIEISWREHMKLNGGPERFGY